AAGDLVRFRAVGGDGPGGAALRPADDVEPGLDEAALIGEDRAARGQRAARRGAIADAGDDEIGGQRERATVLGEADSADAAVRADEIDRASLEMKADCDRFSGGRALREVSKNGDDR